MDIFTGNKSLNLLPADGTVYHVPYFMRAEAAQGYFERLRAGIPWQPDEAIVYGKHITTRREYAWFADEAYRYTYSGIERRARLWTDELLEIKGLVEGHCGEVFNACLLNLYHDGADSMLWHSDDESTLAPRSTIASLSLGAERKFAFKHKQTKERIDLMLRSGSLVLMKGDTQQNWLHSLPKMKGVRRPRINLTFRQMNQ